MYVFEVRVDNVTRLEIESQIKAFLDEDKFHHIATINPEILLLTEKNQKFRETLNACEMNPADGFGLHLAAWRRRERLRTRYPGADLMDFILREAEIWGFSIFLATRADGLSTWQETRDAILKVYPELKIDGADINLSELRVTSYELRSKIENYHLVLCNFGAPEQEYFLASLREQPNIIRLAMGVGGTFDYLTGKISRAPKWIRTLGLEWLWRLIRQPRRWQRIVRAVFLFPLKVFLNWKP